MNHIVAGPHLHTEPIEPREAPTEALLRALDRVPHDAEPPDVVLNDFVDPDALDGIFDGDRPAGGVGVVTFVAWALLVNVSADGVSLYETRSRPSVGDATPANTRPDGAGST